MNNHSPMASTLEGLLVLAQKHPKVSASPERKVCDICEALNEFTECVRYLNTRRSESVLALNSEATVQDAIYLILRPWIRDLVPESPTGKVGNRYGIRDFVSKECRLVIEIKYIRNIDHGRHISKELHDDIEIYRDHAWCDTLIFFIYDPDSLIPDQCALKCSIEISRAYAGKSLHCYLIVKP